MSADVLCEEGSFRGVEIVAGVVIPNYLPDVYRVLGVGQCGQLQLK